MPKRRLHFGFVLALLFAGAASCASSQQGANGSKVSYDGDPCQDSMFVALQNKPYSSLTAYEHAYFQQKYDECNGLTIGSHGTTPEWILAAVVLLEGFFFVLQNSTR